MKKEVKPLQLSVAFQEKLSLWLYNHTYLIKHHFEDYQQTLYEIIRDDFDNLPTDEEKELITKMLSDLLSLSFILLKDTDEVEQFHNHHRLIR